MPQRSSSAGFMLVQPGAMLVQPGATPHLFGTTACQGVCGTGNGKEDGPSTRGARTRRQAKRGMGGAPRGGRGVRRRQEGGQRPGPDRGRGFGISPGGCRRLGRHRRRGAEGCRGVPGPGLWEGGGHFWGCQRPTGLRAGRQQLFRCHFEHPGLVSSLCLPLG